jgi:hypothetical protein
LLIRLVSITHDSGTGRSQDLREGMDKL